MAFIPYSTQEITAEDLDAVRTALQSAFLTQGPQVVAFEAAFAELHHVAHAVAVSNATAGLHLGCLALGVDAGSTVWTSPNSFIASANCALYCGAAIDFVDIDPVTRNMSLQALRTKLAAADAAKRLPDVVIPVDFSGLPCDLKEIRALADQYGFKILEDASHATGASYEGQMVGSVYADATVFSFHAVKIITTGEGGMVTTQDAETARRLRLLRSHGMSRDVQSMVNAADGPWYYEQSLLGFNYRITDLQAALGVSQLSRLSEMYARREALANRYDRLLSGLPLQLPARVPDRQSAYHLYAVEIDGGRTSATRATVYACLQAAQIGVNVHYIPIHTQPYYARLGFKRGDFPNSERYYARALSLPLFPAMTEAQQDFVVQTLAGALEK
jgi:UDP-4-amino-4,6-dideoxy-N-acetyl-beta-L-altrosamine transaminase